MLRQLLRSSITAARRAVAWNLKDLSPPSEQILFDFSVHRDFKRWQVYTDSNYGGMSTGVLKHMEGHNPTGMFSGNLSMDLADEDNSMLKRSGFAGIQTEEGKGYYDLEPYDSIAFRLKGDGRCYVSSLRTENWVGGSLPGLEDNVWQAVIVPTKDEWGVVKVPLSSYRPTWRGKLIEARHEMNASRVIRFSISCVAAEGPEGAVQGPGPYRLELDWIKAISAV